MVSIRVLQSLAFSSCLHAAFALPQATPTTTTTASHTTIFQFSDAPTPWIENIAVRSNGNLLVTRLDKPALYQIVPPGVNPAQASLVHTFPGVTSLFGISEYAPDVFGIITGNFSFTTGNEPGSFSVWTGDFTHSTPTFTKITDIPEAQLLNGLTTLSSNALLASDSFLGEVFRIDIQAKTHSVVLKDATMAPVSGGASPLGINGIRYGNGYVYYNNDGKGTLNRVQVKSDGTTAGPFTVLASNLGSPDDLALADSGIEYVALNNPTNELAKVGPGSNAQIVLPSIQSPTSAQFGRRATDKGTLYVVTGAGAVIAVNVGGHAL